MPRRDPAKICEALAEVRKFFVFFERSTYTRVKPLEQYIQRLQAGRPSAALLAEIEQFTDELQSQAMDQIRGHHFLLGPHHSEEGSRTELQRVFVLLRDAFYPPEPDPPTLDASGFVGSEFVKTKQLVYHGDSDGVRAVFERSVEVVRRHVDAIAQRDFQKAYEDISASSKTWMSLKKFIAAHEQASERFSGPPFEFRIDGFSFILADAAARKKSTNDQGWPKSTPKEERRASLSGFWFRDQERRYGCCGSFWIVEESGEYRLAKFDFWRP